MKALVNYTAEMPVRPRYHANDTTRDVIDLDPQLIDLTDARFLQPALDIEGFEIVPHVSAVKDFADRDEVWNVHRDEIAALVKARSGADAVVVNGPGLLRFGERSGRAGSLNNSRPARFIHVDISDATAASFAEQSQPGGRKIRRFAHYNVWRALSDPPQDVPLGICDARSVVPADLIEADAVFDESDKPEWSFVGLVVRHNPAHRWYWFSNMTRDEALIFKTNDSDPTRAHCVPHTAFDNPDCPADAPPRMSIEMRAIAYWHG